ncbi:SAM-dependent methyltransferase [Peterkaempfera bronchialis]|uniref:SAM-dependent methyltransferase n=1 Tax=Peterkaempfera bronchialis TaxID=2126346 RepID=UPI003C2F67FA
MVITRRVGCLRRTSGGRVGTEHRSNAADRLDPTIAHNARVWNYWLGGKDHYAADREAGDHVFRMFPDIVHVARADREFLGRAVRFLADEAGIRQFLDIGTGLPTAENTHEVAQRVAPESRIVYADNDALVLVHARALLTSSPQGATDYVDADIRDTDRLLEAAGRTLDFSRPVAIMLLGVLNFVLDTEEAQRVVRRLMDAVPSGSYLVLTHPTLELGGEGNVEAMQFWNQNAKPPITARSGAEVARFLDGLELLEPGLVSCARWRPDPADGSGTAPAQVAQYGAVARKP